MKMQLCGDHFTLGSRRETKENILSIYSQCLFYYIFSQKREKDGEQHLKEEEMRRREKLRQHEAKVRVK